MKKRLIIGFLFTSLMLLVSSCASPSNSSGVKESPSSQASDGISYEDVENPQIINETKYYKLLQGDNYTYYYYIYNDDNEVVDEGGYGRIPALSMANDTLVKLRIQAGTGIGTSSTRYFNTEKNVLSPWFSSVYAETGEVIVMSDYGKLIVQNIFDRTAYYREFTEFNSELANTVEPFVNVEFVSDGNQIIVTYLSGEDFVETTETIVLN